MINLVISIPVHIRAEVVIDQIVNLKHFCPTSAVVIHISNGFNWKDSLLSEEEFLSIVQSFENVFINSTRLNTAFADIVHTHVSNFEYITRVLDFEYFGMSASNELFVRAMPPIKDGDANFGKCILEKCLESAWHNKTLKDDYLYKILDYLGANFSDVLKSQIEGSFYSKGVFQRIVDVINKFYSYEDVWNKNRIVYPREEIYYPTIANILNKDKSLKVIQPNYTCVFWANKGYLPTTEQIMNVVQGKMNGSYSIKRVLRDINDPVRVKIGTEIGNYRRQVMDLIINAKGNRPALSYSTDTDVPSIDINDFANRFSPSYHIDLDVTKVELNTPRVANPFIKVLIFVSGKDRSNLKPALSRLAQLYPDKELKIIGSAGVYPVEDVPCFQTNDISKQEADFIVVTGGSVDINGPAPNVHFGDVLAELKALNIPEDKIILDRVLAVPNFTFDKYKKLKESRPTIFAMNCFGGVVYHRFGLPFYSPTINMFTDDKSMINFLRDPIKHMNAELQFHQNSGYKDGGYYFPIFSLGDDVFWNMNHYGKLGADFAKTKWNERKQRINWDNVIAFVNTTNPKILDEFEKLPFTKKFCFVPFPSDKESAVYLDPALDPAPNGDNRDIGDLVNRFGLGYNNYNYDLWDMLLYGKKSCY